MFNLLRGPPLPGLKAGPRSHIAMPGFGPLFLRLLPIWLVLELADRFGWVYWLAVRAAQRLSALLTVRWDPLGRGAAPIALRPPVTMSRRALTPSAQRAAAAVPRACAFRVAAASARDARRASWVYRWYPSPDLDDWTSSLRELFGGAPIPTHTLVLLGDSGLELREEIVVVVEPPAAPGAPARRHLAYSADRLGWKNVTHLDDPVSVGDLDPAKIILAARAKAANESRAAPLG